MKISDIIGGGNQPKKTNAKVVEGAPELLKAEMPLVRHIEKELAQYGYEKGTAEYDQHFKDAMFMYRKFGNVDAIKKYHVEESGHQDDTKEKEENFRYSRSRSPVVDEIRKKLNPNQKDKGVAEDSDPCWNGYEQIGMKEKDGKEVPNCVPTKEMAENFASGRVRKLSKDMEDDILHLFHDEELPIRFIASRLGLPKEVVIDVLKSNPDYGNIFPEGKDTGTSQNVLETMDAAYRAWNSGMDDEEFIEKFGQRTFDTLTKKYGVSTIPVHVLHGYTPKEPTDPLVRSHRGLDGMGKRLKSIIKSNNMTEESEPEISQCKMEDAPVEVTAYYFDKDDRKHAGKISFKNENAARAWAARKNAHILEMKLKK